MVNCYCYAAGMRGWLLVLALAGCDDRPQGNDGGA